MWSTSPMGWGRRPCRCSLSLCLEQFGAWPHQFPKDIAFAVIGTLSLNSKGAWQQLDFPNFLLLCEGPAGALCSLTPIPALCTLWWSSNSQCHLQPPQGTLRTCREVWCCSVAVSAIVWLKADVFQWEVSQCDQHRGWSGMQMSQQQNTAQRVTWLCTTPQGPGTIFWLYLLSSHGN